MNRILPSSLITPSPKTDEHSFTTSTGFRSSAPKERGNGDEGEKQGPRVFIEANEEGKATHRSGDKIGHVALLA